MTDHEELAKQFDREAYSRQIWLDSQFMKGAADLIRRQAARIEELEKQVKELQLRKRKSR